MASKRTIPKDEQLRIEYIALSDALEWEWESNPKRHDVDGMIEAFEQHGFRDPPIFDGKLKRFPAGNGRTGALAVMKERGLLPPRGIGVRKSDGEWIVPVMFGNDAASSKAAERFAVDHNNVGVAGLGIPRGQLMKLWTRDDYEKLLKRLGKAHRPTTISEDDLDWITSAELHLPGGEERGAPELESEHLVTIECSSEALEFMRPMFEEWHERDDVTIDVA